MAGLGKEHHKRSDGKVTTTYRVLSRGLDGRRHTIRLGKVSKAIATTTINRIEALEAARMAGTSIDADTTRWLAKLSDDIYGRLVKAELVLPRKKENQPDEVTIGQWLDQYFHRIDLDHQKKRTRLGYERARRLLEEFFGNDRRLVTVAEGHADDYKAWLLKKFSPATVSVDLRRAKQFFKQAVRRRLLAASPFEEVKCGSQRNRKRQVLVSQETIEAAIDACPNNDWRLIFALARYAGLRIPSELQELRWCDVNWSGDRFLVRSPKTEHHEGHEDRVVPIFAELRPHLERAFDEAPEGAEFVVPRAVGKENLSRYAGQILERAGIEKWPKLFVNLRASRATELEKEFPAYLVDRWIGNSSKVRQDHYLVVAEDDYREAASRPVGLPGTIPGTIPGTSNSQQKASGGVTARKKTRFSSENSIVANSSSTLDRDRTCNL